MYCITYIINIFSYIVLTINIGINNCNVYFIKYNIFIVKIPMNYYY